jgi:hypothetical protein
MRHVCPQVLTTSLIPSWLNRISDNEPSNHATTDLHGLSNLVKTTKDISLARLESLEQLRIAKEGVFQVWSSYVFILGNVSKASIRSNPQVIYFE